MAQWVLLIFIAFAAVACCTEVEDNEQKKRGVGKGTSINSIPTGAQKQEYTYNIYTQSPTSQSGASPTSYQSQVPNSFYPNQGSSQYYSSQNTQADSSSYVPQQQQQISLLPPASPASQFVPLNFVPNPGYQTKYQLVPSKTPGNIQLIFQQPNNYPNQPIVPYAPQLFSPNPTNQISSQQASLPQYSLQQGQFNVAPNYQPFSNSYLGQPSTMLLFAQPNPGAYSNLLYSNPLQSFYNYYPSASQSKYNVQYVPQSSSTEYEKIQGPVSQSISKDDNDIAHSNEYRTSSDASSSYKDAYTSAASRTSYAKL